jgi:monoamine oxidase
MWTAWAGGTAALRLASHRESELVDEALLLLARAFHVQKSFLRDHLERHFFHSWLEDPFSRGAYSYIGVDGLPAQKILRQPEKSTLFFAGEALNEKGQTGTVDAAIASGERAARLVLKGSRSQ